LQKNKEEIIDNENNQVVAIQLDSFPLVVGYSWKYYTEMHIADSAGVNYLNNYYDNYWVVLSDTTITGVISTKITQLDSNYNATTHLTFTYYANKPDGLYGMAV